MINEFERIIFDNEELIVVLRIQDSELGEVLLCMSDEGKLYLNNNEKITSQEVIDRLDEKFWRSPKNRNILENKAPRSVSALNKNGIEYSR